MKYWSCLNLTVFNCLYLNSLPKSTKAFIPIPIRSTSRTTHLPPQTSTSTTTIFADLITFDLDDTIFPVGPVVHDANQALIEHLNINGYHSISQESLIASTKYIRNELLKRENNVITYTELRKRAICFEMNRHNEAYSSSNSDFNNNIQKWLFTDDTVIKAYDIWEMNRHLAAERHLYHDAISMLQSLKEKYPDAIIGAITNGKGNPLMMKNSIHEYFDFCVSGEDQNVFPYRKPHQEIYFKSLDVYKSLKGLNSDLSQENELCWFHVGDDLANDVGASAKSGARAIWVELGNDYNQSASKRFGTQKNKLNKESAQPFWSTATNEEIAKRKKLNEESMTFVSARIETLSDLPNVIQSIVESSYVEDISIN